MKKPEGKQLKKRKKHRRLFIFIAVFVLPVVVILLVELGLRIIGFGYDNHIVKKCTIGQEDYFCNNDDFSRRFFNSKIAREFVPFTFSKTKPKNTYRIFIFGSSAAKGEPDSAYSFGRILEVMLERKYHPFDFDVINTALTAVNSHVVLKAVQQCCEYEPDTFVVYMGNNEVVGPYGAGTVFSPISSNLGIIRASIFVRGTKIGQLLSVIFEKLSAEKNAQWGGMEMFSGRLVRFDDKSLQKVYENFEKNLDDICKIADSKEINLILCNIPTNVKDCAPFASVHRRDMTEQQRQRWDELYKQGVEEENKSSYARAIEYYLAAQAIDGQFANLPFRLGNCLYNTSQYGKAKERFELACRYDALRFRADSEINRIIKTIADENKNNNLYFADALGTFEQDSLKSIVGDEFFYEHVHFNFKGNYILAKCIFEQLEKSLPEHIRKNKTGNNPITEEQCARLLGFTDWDRYRTEKRIVDEYILRLPFTNQLYHNKQTEELKNKVESLKDMLTAESLNNCAEIYQKAIENRPDDWQLRYNFAQFLSEGMKDYQRAAEQMCFVVEKVPQNYQAVAQLGVYYSLFGDFEKAEANLKRALSIKASDSIYFNLAVVYQKQGKFEDAIKNYKNTVRLNPKHGRAWSNMTALLGEMKRYDEAIKLCRQALENLPDDEALNLGLAVLLVLDGQKEKAVEQLNHILEKNPSQRQARQMLEKLAKQDE